MPEFSYFRAEGRSVTAVESIMRTSAIRDDLTRMLKEFFQADGVSVGPESTTFIFSHGATLPKYFEVVAADESRVHAAPKAGTSSSSYVRDISNLIRTNDRIVNTTTAGLPLSAYEKIGGAWYVRVPNDADGKPEFDLVDGVRVSDTEVARLKELDKQPKPPVHRSPLGPWRL